ncbi:MAG: ATP-dependent DNA helicase RecG [Synergistaceae bacterium]|nr:ATP-dependent DNA helicase RecG [Synergistaceae bacterium]
MTFITPPQPKKRSDARLSSPATVLSGVGPKKAEALGKLGVFTLEDLIFLMPRRYEDRRFPKPLSELKPGNIECAVADVADISAFNGRTEAVLSDSSGIARAVWFTDKIADFVRRGMRLALYGPISDYYVEPQFSHPAFEILYEGKTPTLIGKIFPIYPGTAELPQKAIKKFVDTVLETYSDSLLKDFLPSRILTHYKMMSLKEAVMTIHNPADEKQFIRARNRLSFDELFLLQAGIMLRRRALTGKYRANILKAGRIFREFSDTLPFKMTDAQRIAVYEILEDVEKPFPMNRLLQGDVGSGKTLVAIFAMLAACDSGVQSAFMAPTEILAQQHYMSLTRFLAPLGVRTALLTGSLKASERREILAGLYDGSINIAVGTHALFSGGVTFNNLALTVIDEQHRFGVLQRGELASKAKAPHVLAMTATPIPRTLIMSIYGDLEVSTLNEMPKGRKTIKTSALMPQEFKKVYGMIREQVHEGHQIYWVCPLIGEGERELANVIASYEMISSAMPEMRAAVLHGQLPIDEKSRVMSEFSAGNIDILVATTVIEVGVDVPNATMIVIQDAGQFGLSQLHQLRGRVGRGDSQSYCVLLENDDITDSGRERISAMVEISDGFELSERDLIQRGPGEICGTHQHGVTDFRVAELVRDEKILTLAREEAKSLLDDDPNLSGEPELKREILRRLGKVLELAAVS